jgi:hypothetical protein
MNVLIHMVAILLTTWSVLWFYSNSSPVIALGVVGIDLLLVIWLVQAIVEDVGDASSSFKSRRRGGRSGYGRE